MNMPPIIMESFRLPLVPPEGMDELWSRGWRHFGDEFFRYSVMEHAGRWDIVVPLRVDLSRFVLSKSQRRVLRKNRDVSVSCGSAELTVESCDLFHRHKARFTENVPDELESFLGPRPGVIPCGCLELRCYLGDELVAVSFLDLGSRSVSSVYGMFEPAHAARGLGIFTLLREMEWAVEAGMRYLYPGYATLGPSHYDYKKQLRGLEGYDWTSGAWRAWDHP